MLDEKTSKEELVEVEKGYLKFLEEQVKQFHLLLSHLRVILYKGERREL